MKTSPVRWWRDDATRYQPRGKYMAPEQPQGPMFDPPPLSPEILATLTNATDDSRRRMARLAQWEATTSNPIADINREINRMKQSAFYGIDRGVMPNPFAEREVTDAERIAIADEPRPGLAHHHASPPFDLSQEETDVLITCELRKYIPFFDKAANDEADALLGLPRLIDRAHPTERMLLRLLEQRGGIHSEPLVRLLAYRSWGDRDRQWNDPLVAGARMYGFDELVTFPVPRGHGLGVEARMGERFRRVVIPTSTLEEAVDHSTVIDTYLKLLRNSFKSTPGR